MRSFRPALVAALACSVLYGAAQNAVPPIAPDERVDVTGDGVADMLITTVIDLTPDTEQGLYGWYRRVVRTMPGTSILNWSTLSTQRWYTVPDSASLDTAELAARIHFKQLSWTDAKKPTEFKVLERPFGPGIGPDRDGWYGGGEHYDGVLLLRSVSMKGTSIATFTFDLPFPLGGVVLTTKEAMRVPPGFGERHEPLPNKPPKDVLLDFGHEEQAPQVVIPAGLAPDESIDLTSDDIPDLMITSENSPFHATTPMGTYHRGLRMTPEAALLMEKQPDGQFAPFRLKYDEELTPDRLNTDLQLDRFRWARPPEWPAFIYVLEQRYGAIRTPDEEIGWLPSADVMEGLFVFRAAQYGRPVVGAFEIEYETPGGQVGVRMQGLAEEGDVLNVR
ncbi:MAG: hypothetical protein JNM62_13780 [Flavobacteriales bacterium]|nr:hypothetical protein [Flavobacteriales bacterium]